MESSGRLVKKSNSRMRWLDRLLRADDRQQKLLEEFYKEYVMWNWSDLGRKLGGGLMIGIGMFFQVFIPWQSWNFPEDRVMVLMSVYLEMLGIDTYLRGYREYTESGKIRTFGEIFMLVPVAGRQLAVFRLKRAISLCFKLFIIVLMFQVIFAAAIYHGITAGNILFPVVGTFIIPMTGCIITEYMRGRRGR